MKIARILAATQIDEIDYAVDQVVAFEDAQAAALESAALVEIVTRAGVFVEHDANRASRGLA